MNVNIFYFKCIVPIKKAYISIIAIENGIWDMWEKMNFESYLGILLLAGVLMLFTGGLRQLDDTAVSAEIKAVTVVVDSGHGGDDPGKVGINNALEKDLNLAIAKKLEASLKARGITVVMTRESDAGLYDQGSSNKKQEDMRRRCEKIDKANPVFTVSIHQNSYTQESVHGPQVFYYTHSAEGKEVAACIQEAMNTLLQVDRPREIKANDTYYLLKKTKNPTIIVECGFLSNGQEAAKLVEEEYQQKVAQAVCHGILDYLEKGKIS